MNFKRNLYVFIIVCLNISCCIGNSRLPAGIYEIELRVNDPDEWYPVIIQLSVSAKLVIENVTFNYPTYNCKSSLNNLYWDDDKMIIDEKMDYGKNKCSNSSYIFQFNNSPIYELIDKKIKQILISSDDETIFTKIKSFSFKPSKLSSFRIKYKLYKLEELYKSTNQIMFDDFSRTEDYENIKSLIKMFKQDNTFNSYLYIYILTKSKDDLRTALDHAKTYKDKILVERLILKNIDTSKTFKIKEISSSSTSELRNLSEETISIMKNISEISVNNKVLTKKFELTPKIPLIGNYKVKVNFILSTKMKVKSNLFQGYIGAIANTMSETKRTTYNQTFILKKENGYKDTKEVDFRILGVSTSALGVTMRSNIVGLDITTNILEIIEYD